MAQRIECHVARCTRKAWNRGLCQRCWNRKQRAVGEIVERRTYPFRQWRYNRNRRSRYLHAPSVILNTEGAWRDVAMCDNRIRLGNRKVWLHPTTAPEPMICTSCAHLLRKRGIIGPDEHWTVEDVVRDR